MPKRPLFERVLARIGLQRAESGRPAMRIFQGARMDRITMDWFTGRTSADSEIRADLLRLRNRSRTIVRDTPIGRRYVELFAENVAGEHGLRFRPRCLLPDGERDKVLNQKLLNLWALWGNPENCTLDGSLSWAELHQTIRRLEPGDGEVLLRLVRGAQNEVGFAVQLLDPDQLNEALNRVEPNGEYVQQGVQRNRFGIPVAYWIWDVHPTDPGQKVCRSIPADEILHLYRPHRPGAGRGLPWLHAALESIFVLGGYIEATLVASRMAANQNAFYKPPLDAESDENTTSAVPSETAPGESYELPPGWDVIFNDPKQPHGEFSSFVKGVHRLIAAAGSVSYTSLSGDLEAVNYSSIRAGLLAERDQYRMLQRRDAIHLARPLWLAVLKMAQLTGAIRLTEDEYRRASTQFDFIGRGFPWVDPEKDINALGTEIQWGINSRTRAIEERGRDFEATLAELDQEQQLASEYDVDVSGPKSTPAPKPAAPTPDITPNPDGQP